MAELPVALVWCPFPDRASAREVVNTLLDQKLIACANLLGEMESIFEWDGERDSAAEIGVLLKTSAESLEPLVERLGELHPYEIPAIIGWKCDAAHHETERWLGQLDSHRT